MIKQDKGTAGLTILLSVVVMLFVIGLLVMIFSLMGSSLSTATYDDATASLTNVAVIPTVVGTLITGADAYRDYSCAITSARNGSASGDVIGSGNYTVLDGCLLQNLTNSYPTYNWYVNSTVSYKADNTATTIMNDTTTSIASATDWFDIFIVIASMVVLILLTVIIITAIRSSGMVAGEQQGVNSVGTA